MDNDTIDIAYLEGARDQWPEYLTIFLLTESKRGHGLKLQSMEPLYMFCTLFAYYDFILFIIIIIRPSIIGICAL